MSVRRTKVRVHAEQGIRALAGWLTTGAGGGALVATVEALVENGSGIIPRPEGAQAMAVEASLGSGVGNIPKSMLSKELSTWCMAGAASVKSLPVAVVAVSNGERYGTEAASARWS